MRKARRLYIPILRLLSNFVEHCQPDKLFEEVVEYMPEVVAELVKINTYLEDEKLFRMIKQDLTHRYPKTGQTGRNSTPRR